MFFQHAAYSNVKRKEKQLEHSLDIKKLIHGGAGLGYLEDGLVTMVPFVLPGETVVVAEKKRTKKLLTAELVQVRSPAPERQTPPCPYYMRCGGCNLQHIDYLEQARLKRLLLQETLERSKIDLTGIPVENTLASPESLYYRHRIRLHLDKKQRLGFYRIQSNQIIPLQSCLLATDTIHSAVQTFVDRDLTPELATHCKAVEFVASPHTGEVTILLHPRSPRHNKLDVYPVKTGGTTHIKIKGAAPPQAGYTEPNLHQRFTIPAGAYQLSWDHNCFFQTNPQQNQQLVELLCSVLEKIQPAMMLDLFCGIGNFSIPAALMGWKVIGVEHNHHSIYWAKYNSKQVAGKATFICEPVAKALKSFTSKNEQVDLVLVDPPRQGLEKQTVQAIIQLAPKNMIYISCDPATLGRDLNLLIAAGFSIKNVTPIDMFPQTHHIESLVVLEKN